MTTPRISAVLFAAVLFLPPAAALAEEETGPVVISDQYLEELREQLKLEDKQYKQVSGILDEARPRVKKKWDAVRKLQKKMRVLQEALEKAVRETNEKIREELTYEQRDRFDAMRLRRRSGQRRRPRMRGIDMDPADIPPGILERLERKERMHREFPPERWEQPRDYEKGEDLPPELREYIERRMMNREQTQPGRQEDVPPAERWDDRAPLDEYMRGKNKEWEKKEKD